MGIAGIASKIKLSFRIFAQNYWTCPKEMPTCGPRGHKTNSQAQLTTRPTDPLVQHGVMITFFVRMSGTCQQHHGTKLVYSIMPTTRAQRGLHGQCAHHQGVQEAAALPWLVQEIS